MNLAGRKNFQGGPHTARGLATPGLPATKCDFECEEFKGQIGNCNELLEKIHSFRFKINTTNHLYELFIL